MSCLSDLFINVEVCYADKPTLEKAADLCLQPARYLLGGRKIEYVKNLSQLRIASETASFTNKNWLYTAFAALAFIPSIVIGSIAKAIQVKCLSPTSEQKRVYELTTALYQLNVEQRALKVNSELEQHYQAIVRDALLIKNQLKSSEQWDQAEFINQVSLFMENGSLFMNKFFRNLHQEGNQRPEQIAELLSRTTREDGGFCYSLAYFYNSLAEIYHLASCRAYYQADLSIFSPEINKEYRQLYFRADAPQCRWREVYNAFCDQLSEDVRAHLAPNFRTWAQKDEELDVIPQFPHERLSIPANPTFF